MFNLLSPLKTQIEFFEKHGQSIIYKKGHYIVSADNPSPWVYMLKEGHALSYSTFSDGTDRILSFIPPGMPFAQLGSFFNIDSSGLEYRSVDKSIVLRIPNELFLKQLSIDKSFQADYMQSLLRNQMHLVDRILYQGEKDIYARTIRWIIFMNKYYGVQNNDNSWMIGVPLTQEIAGNFMYITRESVNAS
ncbi:Crp/Fnr family transcriptional regulator, partial [Candidatus Saccharibacteria bacterium]|nr:Crp/Fnr family transcriptional regulator [Candidatus Saccharibacteria bacterium]